MQAIEAIQRMFTYKIIELQHLNCRERLHKLNHYSLQRRRECYIFIYIWKITQHMYIVPNIEGTDGHKIKTRNRPIHGTLCYRVSNTQKHNTIGNSIAIYGPRFYDSLPKYLRDTRSIKTEKPKFQHEKFLPLYYYYY